MQGCHQHQTTEALVAAASHLGPEAVSLATVLNKQLGLPFGKTAAVLKQSFGLGGTQGALSQALARISRLFKDGAFRTRLMAAHDAEEMYRIIADEDAKY